MLRRYRARRLHGRFNEQQSTTKSLTHTRVEGTRLSVLSRPIMEKLSSSAYFETHFIEGIERLSNIALRWKSAIGWMRQVLGLQNPPDEWRTIDVTPSKRGAQIEDYLADVRNPGEAKKAVTDADFISKPKVVKTGTDGD